METLRCWFFEDPLYLYVLLAIGAGLLAIGWRARRTRRSAMLLIVPPVLAIGVFALELAVVTDRERIIGAAEHIARDLQAGSLAAAEQYLDERFAGPYGTREEALAEARRTLEQHKPKAIELADLEVTVSGRDAEMSVTTVVEFGAGMLAGRRLPLGWEVHWVKVTQGGRKVWRIRSVSGPR